MPQFSTAYSTIDLAAANAVLQQIYLPGLNAQLNSMTVLRDRLQRAESHQFVGNKLQLLAHKARGITHIVGSDEALPPRSKQDYEGLIYDVIKTGQRIGWNDTDLMRTRNAPEGAFIDLMTSEMDGARDDMGQDLNRQYHGNTSGELAAVTVDSGLGTTITVDTTKFLRADEPIVIADGSAVDAGGTPDTTVASITSGTVFETADTVDPDTSDFVYHRRGASTPIHNEDINGLLAIVDTGNPGAGNLGGIDATAQSFWQSEVLANGGTDRALNVRLLKQGLNAARRNGGNPSIGITSDAVMLEYGALIVADKRFPADPGVTLDGGWTALDFAGVPIIDDKDASEGRLYFLTENDFLIADAGEARFEDKDGSVIFRVADFHQFEAFLYLYTQLAVKRRNSHVRIDDILVSNRTDNL